MKTDMNIIALAITPNTVLLAAEKRPAHKIGARGSSPGGMSQGQVTDSLVYCEG